LTGSEKRTDFIAIGEDAKKLLKYISDSVSDVQTEAMNEFPIDFSRLKELTLSIKTESGQTCVKCLAAYGRDNNARTDLPDAMLPSGAKPEFHILKKRLDKIFQIIGERLKAGELPSKLEIDLFCRNAEMMITYSRYEDSMYTEFQNLVVEFENAFRRSNIGGCREILNTIREMKSRCHKVLPP
jgi:XXXCH domain-containing protein